MHDVSLPLGLPLVDTEALRQRLSRRMYSVPLFLLIASLLVALAPAWIVVGALIDFASRGRTTLLRGLFFLGLFFVVDVICVVCAFVFDVARSFVSRAQWFAWHYRLQAWWSVTLLRSAGWLFRLRFEVEGAEHVSRGPVVLLARHVSVGDTLLPLAFLSGATGFRCRYVIKQELLFDPCLDIVGNRIPNVFVRRGSGDTEGEVRRIGRLAQRLGADEGVVIYPEGTRFTVKKRERLLRRLEEKGDTALLDEARRLHHVLPMRVAGAMAALQASPSADLVLCAHTGLEGLTTLRDSLAGSCRGRGVRVRFSRVARAEMPSDPEACRSFLQGRWREVDAYVGNVKAAEKQEQRAAA
ncbi:MAG: lysophospholipid acyltransferase family protein [Myxococcota bacterium]